jgi:asparagine synthase (glutamine-hydrolysing)
MHRGPDDCGLFLEEGVGLGHRRLSIIDVAAGHQPMASDDESMQIVYNGEVYNHAALRAELEARGVRYRTRCDTETVLRMYEAEGARAPRYLRGMFAFAIWDRRARELFLARDRLGVKPLYYVVDDDGSLYFASEIKALLAAGAVAPALNMSALPDYLANHAPSGRDTLFEGVRRLPPGCSLRWRDGEVEIEQYWEHRFTSNGVGQHSDADLIAEYGERFADAVRMRLMSDVPLGVFLSGGIDSAAITAMMSRFVEEPIKTFSVAFAEQEANELRYARLVASRFQTDHHEVVVSPEQFFTALPRLVWHEDEPLAHPSSVALNFVSQLAAAHVKVVLTGEGSDETLAGYGRYRITTYNVSLGRRYERFVPSAVRDGVRAVIDHLPSSGVRQKLSRTFLRLPAELQTLYFDNFSVFSRSQQRALLTPAAREAIGAVDPYAAQQQVLDTTDAKSLLNRLLDVDVKTYLHELLMKQDQMSMAASIESRVPFLDHPLVEFAAALPERLKLHGMTTKYVLREAMREVLPPEILSRKKMGFPVPVGRWFRGAFRGIVDEYVLSERARARGLFEPEYVRQLVERHCSGGENHSERLWSLVNFEIWHRLFFEGEASTEMAAGTAAPASGAHREHVLP